MQGGPQLPRQLTAINKENVVRPAPEAAGLPNPGRRPGNSETSGGEAQSGQTRVQRNVEMWRREPSLRPWCWASCCFVYWDGRAFSVFFTIALGNAPSLCGSQRLNFTDDGETHQRHLWGSLSKALPVHPTRHDPCSGAAPGTPSTAPPGWWPGRRTLPHQAASTTTLTRLPKVPSG